jgi:hypothetical protein
MRATGPFDVKTILQPPDDAAEGTTLGRLILDKQYHGDIDAAAIGQMLSARTSVAGSAAYVAIERVDGTVHGRRGSFLLVHRGIMTNGSPALDISVVPDSGSGQLVGISGQLNINIVDGKHFYDFAYALPEASQ